MSNGGIATNSNMAYKEYLDSELASEGERSIHGIISQVARYGGLKFGTLVINHPFETARLLLQIQYGRSNTNTGGINDNYDNDNDINTNEKFTNDDNPNDPLNYPFSIAEREVPFFSDKQRREEEERLTRSQSHRIGQMYAAKGEIGQTTPIDVFTRDNAGYFQETLSGASAQQQTSAWPLKLDKNRSLWSAIGTIGHNQGLFSIWQGIFAGWTREILMDLGRATVEEALDTSEFLQSALFNSNFPWTSPELKEELVRPCLVAGAAQGIVGLLQSPLEMAKVRLIAQSVWSNEKKYYGVFGALRLMASEETGFFGLFRNPILTFTSYFLKPILRIVPISLLGMVYDPPENAPLPLSFAWLIVQNLSMCVPLFITMPLETIRMRLMVQCASNTNPNIIRSPYITRVRISPIPYTSAFNCFWRMLREEGFGSFYQGWGLQVASITASFATTLLAEMGEEEFVDDDSDGF